jgi:hypothetical protein
MTFSPRRQRGNALLESALSLPLLVGSALLIGDLYNISLARAHLEQSAHSLAATLSMQSRLDTGALEALVQQTASPSLLGDYELLISKVNLDRSMDWKPLRRGSEEGLCPQYAEQGSYAGELPQVQAADETEETDPLLQSTASLLVVQLCRNSDNLALSSGLLLDKDMQAIAFSRMRYSDVELDEALSDEVGVAYDE